MASKALNDLFKYMDSIADQEGAARTQLAKLNHRKQAAPVVLQDLREVQTQELMQRLGKQRKINQQMAEQQAEQGRAPEVPMDPIPVRTSTVGQALGSQVAESARSSVAETSPDSFIAGASAGQPGGDGSGGGIDDATSIQTITETGEKPGWAQRMQRLGSPGLGLIGMGLEAAGVGGPTPIETTRTVRNTPSPQQTRMAEAKMEIERRTGAAQILNSLDNYPVSALPTMSRVIDKMTRGEAIEPEDVAGVKNVSEQQLEASQGNYANLASYRNARLAQEQAKADAKVGAEGAKQRAADLTALSVGEDIQRKSRERAVTEGRFDGFNMARAMFPDLSPKAFEGDTLNSLAADIKATHVDPAGPGETTPSEMQPAVVNTLALRAANHNQVLVKVGSGDDARLDLLPGGYPQWIRLDQTARGNDPRRTPDEIKRAREELKKYGLIEVSESGEVGPASKGNFASTARRLWETGDKLVNTPVWRTVMDYKFSGPGRQGVPGVGKTPAELEAERQRLLLEQQRIQALSGALNASPEGQASYQLGP